MSNLHTPPPPPHPPRGEALKQQSSEVVKDNVLWPISDLSVIIPVYNAEKTISRVIAQTLSQSMPPSEIIIVDDGSTDNTAIIIDEFQNRYPNTIRVIHQGNGGVSTARNVGIVASRGRFITFIDSDDEIQPDYLGNLLFALKEDGSDLAVSGYVKIPSGSVNLPRLVFNREQYQAVIMTRDIGVTFCKVYDGEIIRKNNILFPVGMKASEDAVFYYRYLRYSHRCSFIDKSEYVYYAPDNSKNYGLTMESELIGLTAMSQALIHLIRSLNLDNIGVERLRQRLVFSLNRAMHAIYSVPFSKRANAYKSVEWNVLLPFIKIDGLSNLLLRHGHYTIFEIQRLLRTKLLRQSLSDLIR